MGATPSHIDAEILYLYATGALPDAERDTVAQHVESCGACSAELELARTFVEVEPEAYLGERSQRLRASFQSGVEIALASAPVTAVRPTRRRMWTAAALAAASVALIAVSVYQLAPRSSGPAPIGVYRSGVASERIAVTAETTPAGLSVSWELPENWKAGATGAAVVVRIVDEVGGAVAERTAAAAPVVFPYEELEGDGSAPRFVRVVATSASGDTITSEPIPIHPAP